MPYTVAWLVPHRVIEVTFGEHLSITELQEYDSKVVEMLDTAVDHKIHLLADVSKIRQFPGLDHFRRAKLINHTQLGWAVMIGTMNPLVKAIGLLVISMFGNRAYWCNTREEALVFLQRTDKTLPEFK
jgi:hypothetical protein